MHRQVESTLFYFLSDNIVLKCFSCNKFKYSVKMERGIGTDLCYFFQREVRVKMIVNIVDHFYDPFFIFFQIKSTDLQRY